MQLQRLVLRNFRNAGEIDIRPDPVFNIFWGENAQGKTNLLESIFLLGTLKSFRGARNEDLIRIGQEQARVRGEILGAGVQRTLEVTISAAGKQPRLNAKPVNRAGQFFGCLSPVLFAPEEVALVKGAPAGRRALLDRAIFQADPGYLEFAQEYERILRQRNRLLKEERPVAQLDPWTRKLVQSGARIRRERYRYLQRIRPFFTASYDQICAHREAAALCYGEGSEDLEQLERDLSRCLHRHREAEKRSGTTICGPHRDDPAFTIDGRAVRAFASQGQQRSLMLAFKTAQIMDLERQQGESPILLLDDLTGELDRRRQEYFFRFLLERRGQVFMTTTDLQPLLDEGFTQARRFRVRDGALAL